MSLMAGVAIVVFSDLVDSTALLARLGDDRMDALRRAHIKDVTDVVAAAGGRLIKTLGDGAMASFESALGALDAAAGIQSSVEHLDRAQGGIGIAARVGVAAGEPISDGEDLHGMAVVIASRLCSAAGSGEVLVQDLVTLLVASRDAVSLDELKSYELKGVPEPVRATNLDWRGLAAADRIGLGARTGDAVALSGTASASANGSRPEAIPLPRLLAAYADEPLIGREREVALLREATSPKVGRRAALVLGEPGIGKTRHAAAAASEAHAEGAVVALARCPPEASVPFEPWVRAIGELARAGEDSWRSELARASGAELCALVPELSAHAPASNQTGAGELAAAEGARYRLLSGIAAALGHAAADAPLLVVLDDAHWCDPASAQALAYLLDSPPCEQLVLVVTAREREMGRGHPVSRVLSDLRRTQDLSELRLEGLDAGGLASLVAARVGRAITPRLAARLLARTSGNPLFAAELARDLDERGALGEGEGLEEAPVPDAVADLVQERLARLDPNTERLLVAAAAIGPSAPVSLAARAAGLSDEDAQRAVAEAVAERLVDDVAVQRPTIAFPHALIREALLASSEGAGRARLHVAIAQALETDPETEPAELARHYGLGVAVAGTERAVAAYQAAAVAAAEGHDHEQAAAQLHSAVALLPESDMATRATLLLELGEQRLLAADLPVARDAFRGAGDAARAIGDAHTLALAALGFAGGDIAFGYEVGVEDPTTVTLLRDALDVLGEDEPRLALRIVFRLTWALVFTDDDELLAGLARRAHELDERLGDAESQVFARSTAWLAATCRGSDPLDVYGLLGELLEISEIAERCGRDDLLFRAVGWSVFAHYALGQMAERDRAIEHAAEIAERLGSPRFNCEIDSCRAQVLYERGDRAGAETHLHRAGATLRRLRPDIHTTVELGVMLAIKWLYDGDPGPGLNAWQAMSEATPAGVISALITRYAAVDGDHETVRRRLASQLADGVQALRRPDLHVPYNVCGLALAATTIGDRAAGERLRPLLEPLRPYVVSGVPMCVEGQLPEWHIGRLEMLAGNLEAAVSELRAAIARADALALVWLSAWARVDLALALHRRGQPADAQESQSVLAEGEQIAERHAIAWVSREAATARAELEGGAAPALKQASGGENVRPVRALAARTGRRALAAMVRGQDDEAIERRFSEPRRQRALLKAAGRGFQPAHAGGFCGVIAYELEPYTIQAPPESPWRWAIEVDSKAGRASLIEPAPLEAAVTIHAGLAEWVRVSAGVLAPVTAMTLGHFSVEGDVVLASRLEAMFGGG
jgi:class 3 adenylate cyclase/ATP/maltotriose-dependent transcriptional regulator MalT